MSSRPIDTQLLRSIAAEQRRQAATLAAILRLLERGRGARDAADVALLVAIVESIGDRVFTSGHLMTHSKTDRMLGDALQAADVDDAQQLGCVFRRLEGVALAGFRLVRVSDQRPVEWCVQVCEDEPRIVAGGDTRNHDD